eukprot:NODE_314_length_11212_cov_0.272924.p5 type:complete len:197 gc:universal NODE_314_length_11212_cov_0.272924:10388-10978(+)
MVYLAHGYAAPVKVPSDYPASLLAFVFLLFLLLQAPMDQISDLHSSFKEMTKCRACDSFKDMSVGISKESKSASESSTLAITSVGLQNLTCPPSKETLGNASWLFLHTMASYLPDRPSEKVRARVDRFITDFAELYPCRYCGEHMSNYISENPITSNSNKEVAEWTCRLHNEVNDLVGKKRFDCSKILEHYRYGCQ